MSKNNWRDCWQESKRPEAIFTAFILILSAAIMVLNTVTASTSEKESDTHVRWLSAVLAAVVLILKGLQEYHYPRPLRCDDEEKEDKTLKRNVNFHGNRRAGRQKWYTIRIVYNQI